MWVESEIICFVPLCIEWLVDKVEQKMSDDEKQTV